MAGHEVPTVKIVSDRSRLGFAIINLSDFVVGTHELWDPEKTKKKIVIKDSPVIKMDPKPKPEPVSEPEPELEPEQEPEIVPMESNSPSPEAETPSPSAEIKEKPAKKLPRYPRGVRRGRPKKD
jgi:outer membrane biosynthesis protein TonB